MATDRATIAERIAAWRSAGSVVEDCLARVDDLEPSIRAWVHLDHERARAEADRLDRERAEGRPLGPLHGVPVGIKDIIDATPWPSAAGFGPWAGRMPEADAPLVARLRSAGAIVLGKTVTTPFAWIDPPATRNPWNLGRTPGGSSSGSAAAVAAGMCLAALGSQTGGSITRPAAFCGVCGMKPGFGRLDDRGIVPLAPSLDHPGPIAATVGDLAVVWSVLSGDAVAERPPRPPRIGRLRGLFDDRADPAMTAALDASQEQLRAAGATVAEIVLPDDFPRILPEFRVILAREAARWHGIHTAAHADAYPPRLRDLLDEGRTIADVAYGQAREFQARMTVAVGTLFGAVDALLTPAAVGAAPDLSTTGDPVFNIPWSFAGVPTVTLPIGLDPAGLPLGAQLAGRATGEVDLLAVALWCENVVGRLPMPITGGIRP